MVGRLIRHVGDGGEEARARARLRRQPPGERPGCRPGQRDDQQDRGDRGDLEPAERRDAAGGADEGLVGELPPVSRGFLPTSGYGTLRPP